MVSKRGGALIQRLLRNLLVKVVREDVKAVVAAQGGARSMPEEAIVQFIAGALFGLMMWWLGGKRRLSVEEVDGLFRRGAPSGRTIGVVFTKLPPFGRQRSFGGGWGQIRLCYRNFCTRCNTPS